MTNNRIAVIPVGDQHINQLNALVKPGVSLDNGGRYDVSKSQRDLWKAWVDFWKWVKEITEGYHRVGVFTGDVVDFDTHYGSTALITKNPADIVQMAAETLEPAMDMLDEYYFIRGTEVHVGISGNIEELVARDHEAIKDPNTGKHSWWHLKREIGGLRFDIKHHPPGGGRLPWTEKGAALKLAQVVWTRYKQTRYKMPHYVIRSHLHKYSDSGFNFPDMFACITPSWQYKAPYAHKLEGDADVGGIVIFCDQPVGYGLTRRIYPKERTGNRWTKHKSVDTKSRP